MADRRAESDIVRSFHDLIAWQKAMDLATAVYDATSRFPREEMYGLTSQMRRAAISIASNIAEGQARATRGELLQSLGHAKGSLAELETQSMLAVRLGFMSSAEHGPLPSGIAEVGRLINGLKKSLLSPKPPYNSKSAAK